MHLAVMEEGADRDSVATSQEAIKLFVGLMLIVLGILLTYDMEVVTPLFA